EIFQHPQIEEIGIYGIGKDFPVRVYHTDHGWMETPLYFTSASVLITLLNRMVVETGRRLSTGTPLLNAPIPGYGRMHASIAPVCLEPVEATIRRMIHRPTDTRWLVDHGVISPDALVYLEMALQLDCNLLLAGNTGSGKTTTLNTLLHCLPMNERFIVIEETPELELQQPHTVRLVPDPEGNAGMPRLIRETLRMRPDRVVVGEIRHPEEAFAFIEAVLAGQGKGTYATFHGHSSHETIARLRGFGIPEQDLGWLNILVVQRRWGEHRGGKTIDRRAICEIGEVFFDSANKLVVHPVFTWSPTHRKLLPKQESVLVRERFGWNFPGKQWIFSSKKKKSMSTPKKGKPDAPKMDK
ncbi:MAG: ATPase, T2SS/T4P/T4SS family, partial [archaeon]|nr:ATPase, T2SS/T4P/T4SS family [archaeon]